MRPARGRRSIYSTNAWTPATSTDVSPALAYPGIYRSVWTMPLVFSPIVKTHALYFANQYVFRTTDGGAHWDKISGDLTRQTLTVPATLDPATAKDSAVAGPQRGVV